MGIAKTDLVFFYDVIYAVSNKKLKLFKLTDFLGKNRTFFFVTQIITFVFFC